jgi:hypothetical protein
MTDENDDKRYEDLDRADYDAAGDKLHVNADWFVDNLVAVVKKRRGGTSEIYDSASKIVLFDDEGYISVFSRDKVPVEAVVEMEAQYGKVTFLSDHIDLEKGDL